MLLLDNDVKLTGITFHKKTGYWRCVCPTTGKKVELHTVILPYKAGFDRDHINRDRNDNRRCNLRYVTPSWNGFNKAYTGAFYPGVYKDRASGKFRAQIQVQGKRFTVTCSTLKRAVEMRREMELEHFGENWIDWEGNLSKEVKELITG